MNDKHRSVLLSFRVGAAARRGAPAAPLPRDASAFHRDLKAMVRAHFRGRGRFAHKASAGHFARMGAVGAGYAYCLYAGWWRGDARLAAPLGVCAWFVLANLAHDGSHCAVAASGRANELWALTGAPLLTSWASWYLQHCASHHLHTNEPAEDVDVTHHPMCRWHRSSDPPLFARALTGARNLAWHATAGLVATANMSLVHPWKFVLEPVLRTRVLGQKLAPIFGADNEAFAAAEKAAGRHVEHELSFFRVAGRVHERGLFAHGSRLGLALGSWLAAVLFVVVPFARFGASRQASALTLGPYAVTSVIFFVVTQVSHVQEACQQPRTTANPDFLARQALTSLDYSAESRVWGFLTGGLNTQSLHHVMPGVCSCHYAELYPKFFEICVKHDCAPARATGGLLGAFGSHLRHIYNLGELYNGPEHE